MQMFVNDKKFIALYPIQSKSNFIKCLKLCLKEIRVLNTLVLDKSGEQTSNLVKRLSHTVGMTLRILEELAQWANRVKLYIGLLKESFRKDLRTLNFPMVLWDYCAK